MPGRRKQNTTQQQRDETVKPRRGRPPAKVQKKGKKDSDISDFQDGDPGPSQKNKGKGCR